MPYESRFSIILVCSSLGAPYRPKRHTAKARLLGEQTLVRFTLCFGCNLQPRPCGTTQANQTLLSTPFRSRLAIVLTTNFGQEIGQPPWHSPSPEINLEVAICNVVIAALTVSMSRGVPTGDTFQPSIDIRSQCLTVRIANGMGCNVLLSHTRSRRPREAPSPRRKTPTDTWPILHGGSKRTIWTWNPALETTTPRSCA